MKTKKKLYAITDQDGVFLKRMSVHSKIEIQQYLNKKYTEGVPLAAYELNGSSRKLSKKLISKLEAFISKNDYDLVNRDLGHFRMLLVKLKKYPARDGMIVVNQYFDTFLRELIPSEIWKAMVGKINK
ncbi:hypothetical protein NBT05_02675 [Aquimarina sp. ERC-38]|uniref:hypothetical protein n=1 Tax=Aquimarina sp. ERC-38 TaxID=2949996 RepID=UPI002247EE8B|nr:hypothetical protein [Aquimarina sp. ERC-38]UZO81386.1 hypothetical protein NBT05_02675 [Aquimarina sp. ERC-38]